MAIPYVRLYRDRPRYSVILSIAVSIAWARSGSFFEARLRRVSIFSYAGMTWQIVGVCSADSISCTAWGILRNVRISSRTLTSVVDSACKSRNVGFLSKKMSMACYFISLAQALAYMAILLTGKSSRTRSIIRNFDDHRITISRSS